MSNKELEKKNLEYIQKWCDESDLFVLLAEKSSQLSLECLKLGRGLKKPESKDILTAMETDVMKAFTEMFMVAKAVDMKVSKKDYYNCLNEWADQVAQEET